MLHLFKQTNISILSKPGLNLEIISDEILLKKLEIFLKNLEKQIGKFQQIHNFNLD